MGWYKYLHTSVCDLRGTIAIPVTKPRSNREKEWVRRAVFILHDPFSSPEKWPASRCELHHPEVLLLRPQKCRWEGHRCCDLEVTRLSSCGLVDCETLGECCPNYAACHAYQQRPGTENLPTSFKWMPPLAAIRSPPEGDSMRGFILASGRALALMWHDIREQNAVLLVDEKKYESVLQRTSYDKAFKAMEAAWDAMFGVLCSLRGDERRSVETWLQLDIAGEPLSLRYVCDAKEAPGYAGGRTGLIQPPSYILADKAKGNETWWPLPENPQVSQDEEIPNKGPWERDVAVEPLRIRRLDEGETQETSRSTETNVFSSGVPRDTLDTQDELANQFISTFPEMARDLMRGAGRASRASRHLDN